VVPSDLNRADEQEDHGEGNERDQEGHPPLDRGVACWMMYRRGSRRRGNACRQSGESRNEQHPGAVHPAPDPYAGVSGIAFRGHDLTLGDRVAQGEHLGRANSFVLGGRRRRTPGRRGIRRRKPGGPRLRT
jgi:hypothetical protein